MLDEVVQDFIHNVVRPGLNTNNNETPEEFLQDIKRWSFESLAYLALEKRLGFLAGKLSKDSEQYKLIKAHKCFLPLCTELESGLGLWTYMPNYSKTFNELCQNLDYFYETLQRHFEEQIATINAYSDVEDPPLLVQLAQRGCNVEELSFFAFFSMFAGLDSGT